MAQFKGLVGLAKSKLIQITSQRDQLHETVNSYLDEVTSKAMSALEKETHDLKAMTDVNSMLEAAMVLLIGIGAEISETAALSAPKGPVSYSESPTFPLSVSDLPASMAQRVTTFSESADFAKVCHRLEVLETAVTACRGEVSQAIEQQTGIKTEIETRQQRLEEKLEAVMIEREKKEESIENQLLVMERKSSDTLKQQETRLSAIGDLVKQIEIRISNKMEEMESGLKLEGEQRLNQLEKKYSDTEKRNKARQVDTEEQIKKLDLKWKDVMKQSDSRVEKVDKRLKKVEAGEKEDTARIDSLVKTTEKLTAEVGTMAEKGDIVDLMKMSRTTSKSLEELSSRVDATESFVKSSVSYREREENKKRELEDRILVLESNRSKDTDHIMKKVKEVEGLFHQVCVIVDQRVTPLRRLLRILNDLHKRVEKREQLSLRLDEVTKQVTEMSDRLSNLETTKQQVPVGFTALLNTTTPVKAYTVITDFKYILCNEGGHYDPTTGMFVAPRDGMYVTSVSHQQLGDGKISVWVRHDDASGACKNFVCCSDTVMNGTNGCGVSVVKMKKGEKLYVWASYDTTGNVQMSAFSSFSCFSLG